jgi:hypothetical protein
MHFFRPPGREGPGPWRCGWCMMVLFACLSTSNSGCRLLQELHHILGVYPGACPELQVSIRGQDMWLRSRSLAQRTRLCVMTSTPREGTHCCKQPDRTSSHSSSCVLSSPSLAQLLCSACCQLSIINSSVQLRRLAMWLQQAPEIQQPVITSATYDQLGALAIACTVMGPRNGYAGM